MPLTCRNLQPEHPPESGLVLIGALLVCALTLVCLNVLTLSVFHSATRVIEKRRALESLSDTEQQLREAVALHSVGDPPKPFASVWRPIGIIEAESRSLLSTGRGSRPYPSWQSMESFAQMPCTESSLIQGSTRAVSRSRCSFTNYRSTEDTLIHGNLGLSGTSYIESASILAVLGDLEVDGSLVIESSGEESIEIIAAGDISIETLRILSPEPFRMLIYSATGSVHIGAVLTSSGIPLDMTSCKPAIRLESRRQISLGTAIAPNGVFGCPYQRSGSHWNALTLFGEDVGD